MSLCQLPVNTLCPGLTLSPPIPLRLYNLPYWSNPPECQQLKVVG